MGIEVILPCGMKFSHSLAHNNKKVKFGNGQKALGFNWTNGAMLL